MKIPYGSQPDAYMEDGTPIYVKVARGSAKPYIQLATYLRLLGFTDKEIVEILFGELDD